MAKELLIVFLYDTECNLREDEDPQTAVVYFHPSWVNANQRMALCGQLIGVTQFLITVFSFPRIISLQTGKFTMKKIGRYILCVGTDRNIADSVLEKRSEILYNTLLFFHDDLSMFHTQYTLEVGLEKLTNAMEMYLPTLLYAGNILGNSITIRLPKSGSSIFLEAAQIIECLQDKNGVYGGAIFYQNRVLMSQLSTDVTKQLVVMDPYRIKIPVDNFETSFHLPVGVQLLIVYIDENDFKELEEQKIPTASERKTFHQEKEKEKSTSNMNNASTKLMDNARKDRSKISTVLEEEAESDHVQKNSNSELTEMPDLVKDTVRRSTKQDKRAELSNIDVQSYVVDSRKNFVKSISCSVENLEATESISLRYLSFKNSRNSDESNEKITKSFSTDKDDNTRSFPINEAFNTCKCNPYYNTISDPVNPWFRENGLPASKSLHDDRIAFYCQDIGKTQQVANADENKSDQDPKKTVELNPKRPTSIPLNLKDTSQKKQKARDPDSTRKHLPEFKPPNQPFPLPPELDVPLTPLMSKLSMVDLTDPISNIPCPKLTTPSTSKNFMGIDDTTQKKNDSCSEKENIHRFEGTTRRKKLPQPERKVASRKSILFVYGYQNISIYLILDLNCGNDADLIHFLWSTCFNSVPDLERHFQQCFECVPQTQSSSSAKESYSFVNIHSEWETLQKSGSWTVQQTELLNTLHENFEDDSTITDITIRLPDSVVYANRTGDSQVFYQQAAPPVAGIPMPSDLMGVVPLKAKRRLERDHGLLLL